MKRLFIYELNEVPWPVVDLYIKARPNSNLNRILAESCCLTTNTVDSGELHPWSTWPTVHRGVSNDTHQIRSLNQDLKPSSAYPPVWDLLNSHGLTTGVCGSLQSYPPSSHQKMLFHIPDTFSAGSETKPSKYHHFQDFNLKQTGENNAQAASLSAKDVISIPKLFISGVSIRSFVRIATHVLSEFKNPLFKTRRSLLQPVLAFDVVSSCMKTEKPDLITFFSNHVAGVMHRYWKYSFPEEFDYEIKTDSDKFHQQSLLVAMDLFDAQIGKIDRWCKENNYDLAICSSMGQEAIDRGEYVPEAQIHDIKKIAQAIQFSRPVKQNLAMYPDIALEFENHEDAKHFAESVSMLKDSEGNIIISPVYDPVGNTLNLAIRKSAALINDERLITPNETYSLNDLDMSLMQRDIGTAYHQPQGILIWKGKTVTPDDARKSVDSRTILPTILNRFGQPTGNYMMEPIETLG